MGQLLSSISLAISLRVPLALSFLLPWTVSRPRPSVDNASSSPKAESAESKTAAEGSLSKSGRISSSKEGRNGSGSKRKTSVSVGSTPSKRQHLPRRKASILIHTATDDDVTSTELSSSSSASSDSEGPEHAPKLTPLPPPVTRPRPIPNSYWATPLLLACEYPWCPRTASASGTERPPKLDALLKAGVRCFVDLTEPGELSPYHVESSSKNTTGVSTPMTVTKQTVSVLLQRCAVLGIPAEDVSYYRFPIQDRSLPPTISASSSSSSTSPSSSPSSPSPPASPTAHVASSTCPLLSRALALLSANAAQGKITAVHCRGGIGRTGVVVGCFLVHSGYVSSGTGDLDGDEAGENALRLIEREWKGVAKFTRYPQSPETGPQVEYVRHYRREVPHPAGVGEKMTESGNGPRIGKTTSVAVQFKTGRDDATRMVTTTTTTTTTSTVVASNGC